MTVVSPEANSFGVSGRTALVTGSSRGIGQAIAVALAHAGADIIGVATGPQGPESETAQHVAATGQSFVGLACDFSQRHQTSQLIETLTERQLSVDILINNAGIIRRQPATEHTDRDWDEVLEVNLSSPFVLARELAKPMIQRGGGKIVFVSSVLGFQGGVLVPGYAATKHAIIGLTKALANEWAPLGVNVNAIAPGYTATDNTAPLREDSDRSSAILSRIPAAKWATPEAIAGAAVYLASDAAAYMHGSVITVDGGWLSR